MTDEEQFAEQSILSGPLMHKATLAIVSAGNTMARLAEVLAIVCFGALLLLILVQTILSMLSDYIPEVVSVMSVSWEYAGYLMGAAFMFGLAETLRLGGHIRVNLIFDALKPPHRRIIDTVGTVASISAMIMLASSLTSMAARSLTSNSLSTASLTPLWIPQGAFALAAWLFTFQLLVRFVVLLAGLPPEQEPDYVAAPPE